ncbi:hypothetical protein C8J56DRAFT_1050884 [Mycena floridula]|nr:hypothetical protein C8J56DRAFT_1050884 [Mycena floridula]
MSLLDEYLAALTFADQVSSELLRELQQGGLRVHAQMLRSAFTIHGMTIQNNVEHATNWQDLPLSRWASILAFNPDASIRIRVEVDRLFSAIITTQMNISNNVSSSVSQLQGRWHPDSGDDPEMVTTFVVIFNLPDIHGGAIAPIRAIDDVD